MDAGSTRQQASGINGIQMLYRSERGGIKKKSVGSFCTHGGGSGEVVNFMEKAA